MGTNHIRVTPETYKKLNARKDQGDTFDDVVAALVELDDAAEVLTEEWRMAAGDERGERKARVAYQEAASELEHNRPEADDG